MGMRWERNAGCRQQTTGNAQHIPRTLKKSVLSHLSPGLESAPGLR